jgi:hypothetical protein
MECPLFSHLFAKIILELFDSESADLARPEIFAGAAPALEAGRLLFTIRYHSSAAIRSGMH